MYRGTKTKDGFASVVWKIQNFGTAIDFGNRCLNTPMLWNPIHIDSNMLLR